MRIALRVAALASLVLATSCQSIPLPQPVRGPELEIEYSGIVSSKSWIQPPGEIDVQPEGPGVNVNVTIYSLDRNAAFRVLGVPTLGPKAIQVDQESAELALGQLVELGLAKALHRSPMEVVPGQPSEMFVINQTAYISSFEVSSVENAMLADPMIEVANDGVQMRLVPSEDGKSLATEMTMARLRKPMPTVSVPSSSPGSLPVTFQLPVFVNDRLRVTTPVVPGQASILGGMPVLASEEVVLALVSGPQVPAEQDSTAD